jgi:2-C-methyl-D-erythritol 2,4-cyclodiphosphate synthase
MRVGIGYDVHPFGAEGPLVLGGVEIPGAPGLAGHSDADAVAHAVADALLGPAGLDDLGTRYPATDPSFEGAISIELLAEVVADVARAGWSVANVDVVIAAERPSLARHLGAMRASLGETLAPLASGQGGFVYVSVKPKRGEGVGGIGRGEGIAVWAVALLESR